MTVSRVNAISGWTERHIGHVCVRELRRHPGVCQFVFGDGSVRSLSESMDHGVYQLLGAKSDGVTVPAYE
jgi:prepilin-type processing-associated H-X9-DG protein